MTTKNIIRMPWPVISTFQRWPFGVQTASEAISRAPSMHMNCTPGSMSSRRM